VAVIIAVAAAMNVRRDAELKTLCEMCSATFDARKAPARI
jgi:hypothetical protein